jgi:hypothetical protein
VKLRQFSTIRNKSIFLALCLLVLAIFGWRGVTIKSISTDLPRSSHVFAEINELPQVSHLPFKSEPLTKPSPIVTLPKATGTPNWLTDKRMSMAVTGLKKNIKEWERKNVDPLLFINKQLQSSESGQGMILFIPKISNEEIGAWVDESSSNVPGMEPEEAKSFREYLWNTSRRYAGTTAKAVMLFLPEESTGHETVLSRGTVFLLNSRDDLSVDPGNGKLNARTLPGGQSYTGKTMPEFLDRYDHALTIQEPER